MLYVNTKSPLNAALLKESESHNCLGFPPISEADEKAVWRLNKEPYPVWNKLNSALPVDCRCLIYGRASLVAPKSGVILAMVRGTFYVLRVPHRLIEVAKQVPTVKRYTEIMRAHGIAPPETELGIGWIFGTTIDDERQWCREVFDSVESGSAP